MPVERELMRGSGPLAVLQLLSRRAMYGYELVEALERESQGVLAMGQSTLYPLLYNLEAKGLVSSRTDDGEAGRVRRYYSLTAAGQKELVRQRKSWRALAQAMRALGVLDAPAGGRA
ncbi:MAG TPA: PadR family transcriptional regulator [Gemmatimonadaceae bacterium]|nr:PadR family transcriptional regulator [Gemmatimonadaceae bacterium]